MISMQISKIGKCYQSTTARNAGPNARKFQRSESVISPQLCTKSNLKTYDFKDRKVLSVHNVNVPGLFDFKISKIGKCYQSTTIRFSKCPEYRFQRSESVISPQRCRSASIVLEYFKDRKVLSVHNVPGLIKSDPLISKIGKCYQSTTQSQLFLVRS